MLLNIKIFNIADLSRTHFVSKSIGFNLIDILIISNSHNPIHRRMIAPGIQSSRLLRVQCSGYSELLDIFRQHAPDIETSTQEDCRK